MKYIIDKDTAIEEFERACDRWEIDVDEDEMTQDERVDFSGIKAKIIKAIRLGRLTYNKDDGSLRYVISGELSGDLIGRELIIHRPLGAAYTGMDDYKEKQGMHKAFSMLGYMAKVPVATLNKLDGNDIKPLQAVATLFLAD